LGPVRFRTLRVCEIVRPVLPHVYATTAYSEIEAHKQAPLLKSQSYQDRLSTRKPTSVSETFLDTDPISVPIKHGLTGVQSELAADPTLKGTVDRVVDAEKRTMDTHTPFYHSMSTIVYLMGYSVNRFLNTMNDSMDADPLREKFEQMHWFRFPQTSDSSYPTTISDFPRDKMVHPDYDDHSKPVKDWVLAVNPSLFCNGWTLGEGTWDLFITNKSIYPPSGETFFNMMCDHFGLLPDQKMRQEFAIRFELLIARTQIESKRWLRKQRTDDQREIEFESRGNRDLGALFQILVPATISNEIAYPCEPYGVPGKFSGKKMSDVSVVLLKQPHESYTTQARMMLASVIQPDNEVILNVFGAPEFLKSEEGKQKVREFDAFFLEVLAASFPKMQST
ncbi:MAG: hypothetical protein KDK64_03325, partial [Chlamydiia bacterium]|nr:hypothetical protein [Chlamydiia bacterium]